MSAPLITYITTCKGRLEHLKQTLPRVAAQPSVSVVMVDYGCPEQSGRWASENFPNVRVVEVPDASGFSASNARNAGGNAAETPWLAFFDADILLGEDFFDALSRKLAPGHFYRADPATAQTWGSVICEREAYLKVGGYDPVYQGWGGEDDDFYALLEFAGCKPGGMDGRKLSEIPHSDEARTRFHADNKLKSHQRNQVYKSVKFDVMKLSGGFLPLPLRERMYEQIRSKLESHHKSGKRSLDMEIQISPTVIRHPREATGALHAPVTRIARKLNYTVALDFGQR